MLRFTVEFGSWPWQELMKMVAMDRDNYVEALRLELVEMVAGDLTPVAQKYGYSEVPLEVNIKWRPSVLVLGNYSSGKSTLINELLGGTAQATGQAPTDDSFTVITHAEEPGDVRIVEERDGKALLHDPSYPFVQLRKHGQRFASHFRLKKVNSPFLKHLALIDTPGMLDSIAERDRGYDYQEVIGDFAQIADLILVLFDPHKAGTVREAHASLRETLPQRTFEDRVLFVLNRIDECSSLNDLLRVYGTLCWNLSQMTGRKDIPPIHLTYSPSARAQQTHEPDYLKYLDNQREQLQSNILEAPKRRLDHLASYVETHSERLGHLLEALVSYRKKRLGYRLKLLGTGMVLSAILTGVVIAALWNTGTLPVADPLILTAVGGGAWAASVILWQLLFSGYFLGRFHTHQIKHVDELTELNNQSRRDSWQAVSPLVQEYLKKTKGVMKAKPLLAEHKAVGKVYQKGSQEIREALAELYTIKK